MARLARVVAASLPHHVTQRGNRRRRGGRGYCLMPNDVHLILVPSAADGLRAALRMVLMVHASSSSEAALVRLVVRIGATRPPKWSTRATICRFHVTQNSAASASRARSGGGFARDRGRSWRHGSGAAGRTGRAGALHGCRML
jgi:hypothetical protein